jgi:FKBP-type peptidyl-prolyl cis-trans isomerase FkpA
MKKIIGVLMLFTMTAYSCKKDKNEECTAEAGSTTVSAAEEALVISYLSNKNITNAVELDSSGMYYRIEAAGNNKKPGQCNTIAVRYTGRLQDSTIFDQTTGSNTVSFVLGNLIEGWKRGLPLVGEGGKMKLYIPPSMGYGPAGLRNPNTGLFIIPANEIIIFDMELVTVVD